MLENIGGRKVLALLTILVVAVITVAMKGDIPPNFLSILEFLFTGFISGNVLADAVGVLDKKAAAAPVVQAEVNEVDLTPVTSAIGDLSQATALVQQTLSIIINRTGIDKMPER